MSLKSLDILEALRPKEYAIRKALMESYRNKTDTSLFRIKMAPGDMTISDEMKLEKNHFVISSSNVDRDFDIVEQSGLDTENYKKNPVVLWNHNSSLMPIGKSTSPMPYGEDKTIASVEFDLENDPDGLARAIKGKVDKGVLNTASIQFRPVDFEPIKSGDDYTGGFRFKVAELVEWSIVTIPANADAMRLSYYGFNGRNSEGFDKASDNNVSLDRCLEILESI